MSNRRKKDPEDQLDPALKLELGLDDSYSKKVRKEKERKKRKKQKKKKIGYVGYSTKSNVFFAFLWVGLLGVQIYYTYLIGSLVYTNKQNPQSTVSYNDEKSLQLPMVTVCNWNQQQDVNDYCEYCDIDIEYCFDYSQGSEDPSCVGVWYPITYDTPFGRFHCYQYNNSTSNPLFTNATGYSGSMSVIFRVNTTVTSVSDRIGVQSSFTNQVETPDVYGEIRFSPILYDSFYAMQQIVTTRDMENPVLFFQTSSSTIALSKGLNESDTEAYAAVSFAYQVLSVQSIDYSPQYTMINFFGDFAGMIGTLCGLDAIKLLAGIRLIPKAMRKQNFFVIQDHFNG